MTVEQIAILCHEANRVLCRLMGDNTQLPWCEAAGWQQGSATKGVQAVLDGTAGSPQEQHEAWMRDKVAEGWSWGLEKDVGQKTHPCLVAFSELPPEQQAKDYLFQGIVQALKPFLGTETNDDDEDEPVGF